MCHPSQGCHCQDLSLGSFLCHSFRAEIFYLQGILSLVVSTPKRRLSCSLFSWGYLFLFLTFFFLYKFLPFLFTSTCHLCTHAFKSFCLTFRPDYFELTYQELVAFVFWFILELFTNNHNSWEWLDGILWEYCLKL